MGKIQVHILHKWSSVFQELKPEDVVLLIYSEFLVKHIF